MHSLFFLAAMLVANFSDTTCTGCDAHWRRSIRQLPGGVTRLGTML